MSMAGMMLLAGYILLLGVGTFLQKLSMKTLSPFQLNLLMSLGMVVTAPIFLYIKQKSLALPSKGVLLGVLVGFLFAIGSFLFTLALSRMSAGLTTAISLSYVFLVTILSILFLNESMSWAKALGMTLVIGGVAILSWQA